MKAAIKTVSGLEVKSAGNKGRGVFATKDYNIGDLIEAAPALKVPTKDQDFIGYTFLTDYLFGCESGAEVIGLGYTSLYNHSFTSNADFYASEEVIIVKACQNIEKGQEITVDYGWDAEQYLDLGIR